MYSMLKWQLARRPDLAEVNWTSHLWGETWKLSRRKGKEWIVKSGKSGWRGNSESGPAELCSPHYHFGLYPMNNWRKLKNLKQGRFEMGASLVALTVRNLPAMWESWVWSLTWEDPLEEGMATHCSILVWRIPVDRGAWGRGRGYSPWCHKELDSTERLSTA